MSNDQPFRKPEFIPDFLRILAADGEDRHPALRRIRELCGITSHDAAERAKCSSGSISGWESGKTWPAHPGKIRDYLEAIGVDKADIDKAYTQSRSLMMRKSLANVELSTALADLIHAHGAVDFHEFQRLAFDIGMPKVLCNLLIKGASNDSQAAKLIKDWWDKWRHEDSARLSTQRDVTPTAASWTEAALTSSEPSPADSATAQQAQPPHIDIDSDSASRKP